MSNPLGDCPFFLVPQVLVDCGMVKKLQPMQVVLYLFLLYVAQRRSKRSFVLTDSEIREGCGVAPRTSRDARTKLVEHRLIQISKGCGGKFEYTILDPRTGNVFLGEVKRGKSVRVPKEMASGPAEEEPFITPIKDSDVRGLPGLFNH